MKFSPLGEPRPANEDEIMEALDHCGAVADTVNAEITHDAEEGDFKGYSAEVRDNETGDEYFTTLGFADLDELRNALVNAGIPRADVTVEV